MIWYFLSQFRYPLVLRHLKTESGQASVKSGARPRTRAQHLRRRNRHLALGIAIIVMALLVLIASVPAENSVSFNNLNTAICAGAHIPTNSPRFVALRDGYCSM
jgi:hypothetical protein